GLVENVPNVALRLTKPHAEQFGPLDRDEIGSAFVGDRLGKESFTGTWGTVEEHTARRRHAKLEELLRVLDGVLDGFDELTLDTFQATDVVPLDVRDLDDGDLTEGGRIADAEGKAEVLHRDAERV